MEMKSKLKKLFLKFSSSKDKKEKSEKKELKPGSMDRELRELRSKLNEFLLTARIQNGIVIQRNNYTLTKTSQSIYKLEGTENSGRAYSIILNTANAITLNNSKVTGILRVHEGDLNRAIKNEHSTLESFLKSFEDLSLNDRASEILTGVDTKFNWKEVLKWPVFWKEQIFLHLTPNQISLLLVTLGDNLLEIFLKTASRKQKRIVTDELFYMNQGATSKDVNPNTKNLSLYDSDKAFEEFRTVINKLKTRMEKEKNA